MPSARDGSQTAGVGSQMICSLVLCVCSLLKQLVLLATATSGGNKLYHVIVLCVEKGCFFSL